MHNEFMSIALEQAWLGRGLCAPNPSVGAVVVHQEEIIGKDWHRGAGSLHAEQRLLARLGEKARGCTLYVTLEPCTHWGRTPPCVDAIIESGIACVIYGYKDPNPLVSAHNSEKILQDKGIEVLYWPMPALDAFYESYQYWTQYKRPWVTVKIAQSLDGKSAGYQGKRVQITNLVCQKFTHQQRHYSDAILTTAQTIIQDDPFLTARIEKEESKVLAILDRQLKLNKTAKIFAHAKCCYIFHAENVQVSQPIDGVTYFPIQTVKNQLDLKTILEELGALGIHDLWVEAGPKLFAALHALKLCQRTYIYLAPGVLGADATNTYEEDIFRFRPYKMNHQVAETNIITCFDWQGE